MKALITGCALALASLVAHGTSENDLVANALKGDYQAQRNLAYSYATGNGGNGIAATPVKACTWYRVVAMSNSPKVNSSDFGNEYTYCSKLPPDQSEAAWLEAKRLARQVASK